MSLSLTVARASRQLISSPVYASIPARPSAIPGGGMVPVTMPGSVGIPTGLAARKFGVTASLGSIISGIGKIAIGYTQGGIGGGVTALGGILGGGGGGQPGPVMPGGGAAAGTGHTIQTTGTAGGSCVTVLGQQLCFGGSAGSGSAFSAGGGTGIVTGSPTGGAVVTPSGTVVVTKGHHLNKRAYFTKAGYVPAHSKVVKNRRRNPLNPRALSHALSRMEGFERAEKRINKVLNRIAAKRPARRRSSRSSSRQLGAGVVRALLPAKCGCD